MSLHLAFSLRMLNTLDVIATLYVVGILGAPEINPVNAWLLEVSPVLFVVVKLATVAVFSEILGRTGHWGALAAFNLLFLGALASHAACIAVAHA